MRRTATGLPTPGSSLIPSLGLRRIDHVRVFIGSGRPTAQVFGVGHRFPRTLPVSLSVAARLGDAGVPVHIEHVRGEG
jgi:hypothetical protein